MNKKAYSFSVIVAAYNEEKYIADCIRALLQQDHAGEFEIIVVDNGSNDNTISIAKALGVQVISEPQRGVSHALIAGAKAAKGEILSFTDADTRPPEDWLSKLNEAFNSHESVVAAGGPPRYYDGPAWSNFVMELILVKMYMKFLQKRVHGLPGANMSIRSHVYHQAGGFTPGFNWGQDWQMAKKTSNFGKVLFDPEIFVNTSFRRFQGKYNNRFMQNANAIKEIIVASARMVPFVLFNKSFKAQKPVR